MITGDSTLSLKFDGGLSTTTGPLTIAENESPNCKNVHTNLRGTLEQRSGYVELGSTKLVDDGHGLFDYWKDADTHYLMAYIENRLFKVDVVNNVFDGTLDAITFATTPYRNYMEFETFNDAGTNYLIMANHSRNKLQKYNGSGDTTDLSADADMPKPKFIKQWNGYLFCANIEDYESRIYHNNVSGSIIGATDWSATDYKEIRTNDGDYITALAVLKGRLYTFKRYSIHRWTYTGTTPLFSIKESISGTGTISSKSIVNVSHPKYGEVLAFMGADGKFYVFDGSQVYPISTNIENDNFASEFNLSKLNSTYLHKTCGMNYNKKHWCMWSVPTGFGNTWTVAWDYYTDSWWPFDFSMTACSVAESGGKNKPYLLQNDGAIYEFDSGNDDNGTDIDSIYDTKKLDYGNYPLLKGESYIEIIAKNAPLSSISFYHKSDWQNGWGTVESISCSGGGFILGTSKLGTELGGATALSQVVDLPRLSHSEQFRFQSSGSVPAWTVFKADLVAKGKGYGSAS